MKKKDTNSWHSDLIKEIKWSAITENGFFLEKRIFSRENNTSQTLDLFNFLLRVFQIMKR